MTLTRRMTADDYGHGDDDDDYDEDGLEGWAQWGISGFRCWSLRKGV